MAVKVFIDGRVYDPEAAMVPVTDRGFLYGDSVYEVMRTAGGRPVDLDPHLDRLEHSAEALALQLAQLTLIVVMLSIVLHGFTIKPLMTRL
jgi:branched-chain amino acid aminotransferase